MRKTTYIILLLIFANTCIFADSFFLPDNTMTIEQFKSTCPYITVESSNEFNSSLSREVELFGRKTTISYVFSRYTHMLDSYSIKIISVQNNPAIIGAPYYYKVVLWLKSLYQNNIILPVESFSDGMRISESYFYGHKIFVSIEYVDYPGKHSLFIRFDFLTQPNILK